MLTWGWMVLATIAGVAQAVLLSRATRGHRRFSSPLIRLLGVGAVLAGAAVTGHLVAAAAGWATGWIGGVLVLARRRR